MSIQKQKEDMFEDMLCSKNDDIDNAAYHLAVTIVRKATLDTIAASAKELLTTMSLTELTADSDKELCEKLIKTAENTLINGKFYDPDKTIAEDTEDESILAWDMYYIGDITTISEALLTEVGCEVCHPFYENDDVPCCFGADCDNKNCPIRNLLE